MYRFIQQSPLNTLCAMLTTLLLSGCAQANAGPETAKQLPLESQQQVIVLNSKDGKTMQWDSSMPAADLDQALAGLPAEKASKIREMLQQIKQGQLVSHDAKVQIIELDNGASQLLADKIVVKHLKTHRLSEFSDIRQAIRDGKFDKTQLQELQQLIDSKF